MNSNWPLTYLVRTKQGKMIHRRGCHYAGFGKPWIWAESKSALEILEGINGLGIGLCKHCKPLDKLCWHTPKCGPTHVPDAVTDQQGNPT